MKKNKKLYSVYRITICVTLLCTLCLMMSFSANILPKKNPIDKARHWQYKAIKKYKKGDSGKALKYLKRAVKLDRRNEYILEIAKIYEEMGKHKKAYAWIGRITATDYSSPIEKVMIEVWKAHIATSYGFRTEALSGYDHSLYLFNRQEIDSTQLESLLWTNYGVARCFNQSDITKGKARLIHRRDFQQAYEYFDKAVQLDSNNCTAQYNRMVVRTVLGIDPELTKFNYISDSLIQQLEIPDFQSYCNPPPPPPHTPILQKLKIPNSELLFVVDVSGSMSSRSPTGDSRLFEAKKIMTQLTHDLPYNVSVGLLTLGGTCISKQISVKPGSVNRHQLRDIIESLEASGGTPLNKILKKAKTKFSDNTNAQTIFLCTDGINTCGNESTCVIAEDLLRANIKVHAFSLLLDNHQNGEVFAIANCLSQTTGGELLALSEESNEIEVKTEQIVPYLQYLILVQADLVAATFTPQAPIQYDRENELSVPVLPEITTSETKSAPSGK